MRNIWTPSSQPEVDAPRLGRELGWCRPPRSRSRRLAAPKNFARSTAAARDEVLVALMAMA